MSYWRLIIRKTIVCSGCGAVQQSVETNNHLAWCQTPTDPDDGPRKTIRVSESMFRGTAAADPDFD